MDLEFGADARSSIEMLDGILADHPFGKAEYITEGMHRSYDRRLSIIARQMEAGDRLRKQISKADEYSRYRVYGDTIVRCAIQHAHKQLETGEAYGLSLDVCSDIFSQTVCHLESGRNAPLGNRLGGNSGPEPFHGWIWSEDPADDVFSRAFKYLVNDNFREQLHSLTAEELSSFQLGVRLLDTLLPLSARSALNHVHLVVFFAANSNTTPSSSSEYRLVGSVFLSRRLLASPWWVAEHLFHEALHQQLYDFRAGHSLLAPDAQRDDAPRICSLWNVPDSTRGNYWDIHRAIAAFHVYVNLALMAEIARSRTPDGNGQLTTDYGLNRMVAPRIACARAQYLLEQIKLPLHWAELGPAGQRLVEWLASILAVIDESPPPPASFVHLLIDRYWRETRELEMLATQIGQEREAQTGLKELAIEEVGRARRIFEAMGNVDLRDFDKSMADLPAGDPVRSFISSRDLITSRLPNRYTLSGSPRTDEMMRDLVEDSSETLRRLLRR